MWKVTRLRIRGWKRLPKRKATLRSCRRRRRPRPRRPRHRRPRHRHRLILQSFRHKVNAIGIGCPKDTHAFMIHMYTRR